MPEPVVLVTGSTDGIGKATAVELARRGCRVIVHGRDARKADAARRDVQEAARAGAAVPQVSAAAADLASLPQVRRLAADILSRFERLDVLIHNAGVFIDRRRESEDGYELSFAANHLAPFLLTLLLLERIRSSAPARIVVVSSDAHYGAQIDFQDLQMTRGYDGYAAYSRSKLANVLFTYALARRLVGSAVSANALHPGVIATKLLHVRFSGGRPVEEGARTPVYLALSPEVEGVSGRYFSGGRPTRSAAPTYDRQLQERLWRVSRELVGEPSE